MLADPISLDRVSNGTHPILGDRILKNWGFPQPLRRIPSEHLSAEREAAMLLLG